MGARRRILFVEGSSHSLDFSLYNGLFPELSVIPKGSCEDVIRSVKGLRSSQTLHHIEAFGLIDRDDRTEDEINELAKDNVVALDVCSVESLYYCSSSITSVAHRQANSLDYESHKMIAKATKNTLGYIVDNRDLCARMASRRSERRIRKKVESLVRSFLPCSKSGEKHIKEWEIEHLNDNEVAKFKHLAESGDLDGLIARYPLRESGVFDKIAQALECKSKNVYERMVVARLREDDELADKIRGRITPLAELLDADPEDGS